MQEVSSSDRGDVTSEAMHEAVIKAFVQQKTRGQERLNGKLTEEEIGRYCLLGADASSILESAIARFGLSHRSIDSIKKIARTIADLNGNEQIAKGDILEALSYRRRK
jgi:magnesium chelatase family protein